MTSTVIWQGGPEETTGWIVETFSVNATMASGGVWKFDRWCVDKPAADAAIRDYVKKGVTVRLREIVGQPLPNGSTRTKPRGPTLATF